MTARERINGVWRDKQTGAEVQASGAMHGYLYSRPDRFERVSRIRFRYPDGAAYLAACREAFAVTAAGGMVRLSWCGVSLDAASWRAEFRAALDRRITARIPIAYSGRACRCRHCIARCDCALVSKRDRRAVPAPVVTSCGRCTRGRRMGDDYEIAAQRDARAIRDASVRRLRVYASEITTDDWRKRFAHLYSRRDE